jgi:hypothetical protein
MKPQKTNYGFGLVELGSLPISTKFKFSDSEIVYMKLYVSKANGLVYARHPDGYNESFWVGRLVIIVNE